MNPKLATPTLDQQISRLALAQHGIVARTQLRGLGLADTGIRNRLRDGRLHRVHRGVFAVRHPGLSTRGRWLAAVLALGEGAVLSHQSAAALWEVRPYKSRVTHVTVPTNGGRAKRTRIVVHRAAITASEVTRLHATPVTTLPRTLLDLAEVITRRALERTVDEAERLGKLDLRAVEGAIHRNRGRHGAFILASLLERHQPGTTITKSELEERFLKLCRAHSLPRPAVNAPVGQYVVDFLWREHRLIVETDGRASHGTPGAFEEDRARDASLTVAGWRVVRFTYRQVVDEPGRIARMLKALLAA